MKKNTLWTLLLALLTLNFVSCSSDDKEKIEVPLLTSDNCIQFTISLSKWRDMEVQVKGTYAVDWGDGTIDKGENTYTSSAKHRYQEFGEYQVKVWCEELEVFRYKHAETKATGSNLLIGNCPKLTELTLLNLTKTSTLAIEDCPKLEKLTIENFSDLTNLNIGNCTKLTDLFCHSNPLLATIDVSKNVSLETLECNDNALTSLSLKTNEELLTVNAANNQLTSIDFGEIESLSEVDIQGNNLTQIDLSSLTDLTLFNGSNNKFTALDFLKNENIVDIICSGNNIDQFIIDGEAPIHTFICNSNNLNTESLNQLFTDLPQSPVIASRAAATPNSITFYDNPGESSCDNRIIKNKGWKIELRK